MKVLWDELENYLPIPIFSCAISCTCGVIASVKTYREHDYVIRFLKGLNDKFTHSRSQIMMMNPFPNIDKAFSLVIQQERELHNSVSKFILTNGTGEEVVALNASHTPGNVNGKSSNNGFKRKSHNFNTPKGHSRMCT